jgi:putative PIG3 family NAD(P)H quinone oxidoreductase
MQLVRAVCITAHGGPDVLALGTLAVREPGPGEVRIRVAAAGVNRADVLQRRGLYPAPPGVPPDVPGLEYAGTIDAVGEGVDASLVGARVMGIVGGGAYAEAVVVHHREVVAIPEGLDPTTAAALPEVLGTVWDALVAQAEVRSGDWVLVHAAGSGIGTAAVQLLRALGARSVGTSRSEEKLRRAAEAGVGPDVALPICGSRFADQVVAATGGRGADVVLDCVGGPYLEENVRALAPGGRLVVLGLLGGSSGTLPLSSLLARRARIVGTVLRSRPLEEKIALARALERHVVPLVSRGAVRPVIDRVLPMEAASEAHALLEANATLGKLVLRW